MTYAVSSALQKGLYELLAGNSLLAAYTGGHIYDAAPDGPVPDLFVSLGEERVTAASDQTGAGALHRFTITVMAQDAGGFGRAKTVAGIISDLLVDAAPVLERGRVVYLTFERAEARRARSGARRRIDLRFAARVEDS